MNENNNKTIPEFTKKGEGPSFMNREDKIKQANNLLKQLTKAVFWNCDIDKLDCIRNKDFIIERIIDAGLENDHIIMWQIYPYEDIKNIALNMENMDGDMVSYMAFILKIKEENFKCYGKKPWYRK